MNGLRTTKVFPYTREPTDIFGLRHRPQLADPKENDLDLAAWGGTQELDMYSGLDMHFTPCSEAALLFGLQWAGKVSSILEIGVYRPSHANEGSSTEIIQQNKSPDAIYLGVDIEDRHYLQDSTKNNYVIQCDSVDYQTVYAKMDALGIEHFDFIFIDGWHSVNHVVREWEAYIPKLRVGGVVGFHDTNYHVGPALVWEAIDGLYFEKKSKFCFISNEFGIALAKRLQ